MRANRSGIEKYCVPGNEGAVLRASDSQRPGDDIPTEVTLTDEERHNEDTRSFDFRDDRFDVRLLFPERRLHIREDFPAAQFRYVLQHRRCGLVVQSLAVAKDDQSGLRKIFRMHPLELAQCNAVCKPTDGG